MWQLVDPREFSTQEVMGHSCDRLCEAWQVWGKYFCAVSVNISLVCQVSREEQDRFGARSHALAAAAQEAEMDAAIGAWPANRRALPGSGSAQLS